MDLPIKPRIAYLAVSIAALLVYFDTINYPFHFDDSRAIVENLWLRDISNFWPPAGTRYVGFLSFALNYAYGGLNAASYHLVNIAVHLANAVLTAALVFTLFRTPALKKAFSDGWTVAAIAVTAALVFAVHPVQTQAVTYIVQRFASLATFFYLLSVVSYLKARLEAGEKGTRHRGAALYAIALFSAVLAMMTKETAFTLPFAIALCEVMFFTGAFRRFYYVLPFLLTLPLIPLNLMASSGYSEDFFGALVDASAPADTISRGAYFLTQSRVMVTYVRLLFFPVRQNLDYDYPVYGSFFEPEVLLSFILLSALFAFAVWLFARSRRTANGYALLGSFGIFWFFLTLSVESSVIPIKDVIFEHRLYLPLAGAAIGFSSAVFYAAGRLRVNAAVAFCLVLIAAVAPLSIAAHKRNLVWRDGITLWRDVVKKSPEKYRGHINLGRAYAIAGLFDEAEQEFEKVLSLKPDYATMYYNLGVVYEEKGLADKATAAYAEALRLEPNHQKAADALGSRTNRVPPIR